MNAKRNKAWIARNSNNNQIIGRREKKTDHEKCFNINQKWGEGWEAVKTVFKKLLEAFLHKVDVKLL